MDSSTTAVLEPPPATRTPAASKANPSASSSRFAFIDWTRGIAAVIMLQGHVFHSFTRSDLRTQDTYILSQFVGGMPPAIFLFLTGITLAFLMDSRERQGHTPWQRVWAGVRRAGYLMALAFAFRLQLWLFAYPQSDWSNLFKVDILNCMGVGLAVMSLMAVFTTMERIRLCAILGLAIAAASPLVSALNLDALHPFLRAYVQPHPETFAFFPWAAFLAFGVSAGSILRVAPKPELGRIVQWAGWFGIVLVIGAQYFSNIPYSLYAKSDFWLNSPALILIKTGVILLIASFAYLWTTYLVSGWSWVRQLGTTSLLVYWTHTELVYGRWLGYWKESLSTAQVFGLAVFVISLMIVLSTARTRWPEIQAAWLRWRSQQSPLPEVD